LKTKTAQKKGSAENGWGTFSADPIKNKKKELGR
jgi:hypothetical protein